MRAIRRRVPSQRTTDVLGASDGLQMSWIHTVTNETCVVRLQIARYRLATEYIERSTVRPLGTEPTVPGEGTLAAFPGPATILRTVTDAIEERRHSTSRESAHLAMS